MATGCFVFGTGFLGQALLTQLSHHHYFTESQLTCSTRQPQRAITIRKRWPAVNVCTSIHHLHRAVHHSSCFVTTVPPKQSFTDGPHDNSYSFEEPACDWYIPDALEQAALHGHLQCVALASSTSIYGDHAGAIVDEESSLHAVAGSAGWYRKKQEEYWQKLAFHRLGVPLLIFRLAGLYGESRSVLSSAATKKKMMKRQQKRYTSRVHVSDAASGMALGLEKYSTGAYHSAHGVVEVFNLADDDPAPRVQVEQFAAYLRGDAASPELTPKQAEQASALSSEEKRIDNSKAKRLLGWQPQYPTYAEGLRAIAAATNGGSMPAA